MPIAPLLSSVRLRQTDMPGDMMRASKRSIGGKIGIGSLNFAVYLH
jgi:hypothetical protein